MDLTLKNEEDQVKDEGKDIQKTGDECPPEDIAKESNSNQTMEVQECCCYMKCGKESESAEEEVGEQEVCDIRYKIELCRSFAMFGSCRYGEKCLFAHGCHELRDLPKHPKYKTTFCKSYRRSGYCAYGTKCAFAHYPEERRKDLDNSQDEMPSATIHSDPDIQQQSSSAQVQPLGSEGHSNSILGDDVQPKQLGSKPRQSHRPHYKIGLCRSFASHGFCRYGKSCLFAHGFHELRSRLRNPKYKTEFCSFFYNSGFCPYGPKCHYIHSPDEAKSSAPKPETSHNTYVTREVLSDIEIPDDIKPEQNIQPKLFLKNTRYKTELCNAYLQFGTCKYKENCWFAHGYKDLRMFRKHPKYKTEFCRSFHGDGLCFFGPKCQFVHNENEYRSQH